MLKALLNKQRHKYIHKFFYTSTGIGPFQNTSTLTVQITDLMDIVFIASIDCLFKRVYFHSEISSFHLVFYLYDFHYIQLRVYAELFLTCGLSVSVYNLLYWVVCVFFPKSWCLEIFKRWARDGKCHYELCTEKGILFNNEVRKRFFQLLDINKHWV